MKFDNFGIGYHHGGGCDNFPVECDLSIFDVTLHILARDPETNRNEFGKSNVVFDVMLMVRV